MKPTCLFNVYYSCISGPGFTDCGNGSDGLRTCFQSCCQELKFAISVMTHDFQACNKIVFWEPRADKLKGTQVSAKSGRVSWVSSFLVGDDWLWSRVLQASARARIFWKCVDGLLNLITIHSCKLLPAARKGVVSATGPLWRVWDDNSLLFLMWVKALSVQICC